MKNFKKYCLSGLVCLASTSVFAESVPFSSDRWVFKATESKVETFTDKDGLSHESLTLNNGVGLVKNSEFTNGTIEYDVIFETTTAFTGPIWRAQNNGDFELFITRQHNSGKPYAMHYYPFYNGVGSFQLYYDEGRFNAATSFEANKWTHVKMVINGKQAEVYINDMKTPKLFIDDLKREVKAGQVGVLANLGMTVPPIHLANFEYTSEASPTLVGSAKEFTAPENIVSNWMVSDAFSESDLATKMVLSEADKNKHTWTALAADRAGRANLAQVNAFIPGKKDTVYAKIVIRSDSEQIKQLKYGFSDSVKLYLNGQLISGGNDMVVTRDYRFIGTVGFHADAYLHLKPGINELWLAVSEHDFGGWGIQARFADLEGISVGITGEINFDNTASNCVAKYSTDGSLHIPCVSIPNEAGTAIMYKGDMIQGSGTTFNVNSDSIKPLN